jgi:Tfp pilus assembly protein PilF
VEIRRVLGRDEHLIRTVRGRGYRFEASVSSPAGSLPDAATLVAAPAPVEASRRRWPRPAALAGLIALLIAAGALSLRSSPEPPASVSTAGVMSPTSTGPGTHTSAAAEADVAAGRSNADDQTRAGLLRGIAHFEDALRIAPDYAVAWSELSQALTLLHIFGVAEPSTVLPRARQAAERAIALDPTMASAHSALAHVQEQWDRDWAAAEASHRRALALNPQSPVFHVRHALFLVTQARYDEAVAESDRAIALAPASARVHATRGILEVMAGHPDRALAAMTKAQAIDPALSITLFWQAVALMELDRLDDALTAAVDSGTEASNEPTVLVGVVHARAGRREQALLVRSALEAKAAVTYVPATEFAVIDAALGDADGALDWLERGFEEHARWMPSIAHTPLLASLRGHPRFTRLVERLKLPMPAGPGSDRSHRHRPRTEDAGRKMRP